MLPSVNFDPIWRGILVDAYDPFYGRDDCPRDLGRIGHRNLSGDVLWLTFCALKTGCRMPNGCDRPKRHAEPTLLAKSKLRSLVSPISRQPRCLPHQSLGIELLRLPTIDNGRRDVGCQPGKTQEVIDVGCRHALFASDVMHGQLGVLNEACLDVMGASDNPQEAWIGCLVIIRILDEHSHFATDAPEACRRHQRNDIIGATV